MKTITKKLTQVIPGIAFKTNESGIAYLCEDSTVRPGRGKNYKEPSYCLELNYRVGPAKGTYTLLFTEAEKVNITILPELSNIEIPLYLTI